MSRIKLIVSFSFVMKILTSYEYILRKMLHVLERSEVSLPRNPTHKYTGHATG